MKNIKVIIRKSRFAKILGLGTFAYVFYRLGFTDCILKTVMESIEIEDEEAEESKKSTKKSTKKTKK